MNKRLILLLGKEVYKESLKSAVPSNNDFPTTKQNKQTTKEQITLMEIYQRYTGDNEMSSQC